MADTKISALSANAGLAGTDLFAVVDDPAGTPATQKATISQIRDYIIALANTWTATQTITPAANTNALAVTGYSLTGSNAQSILDLTGTWNTTGAPTAIKLNVTNTASNGGSNLIDLQMGSVSQFNVRKDGYIFCTGGIIAQGSAGGGPLFISNAAGSVGYNMASGLGVGWTSSAANAVTTPDLTLFRDAANTLAQRNSTNAQTFRMYFSFTDASNYTRLALKTATTIHTVETESAGTGEANIDLALTPKGTGRVRYGTHSAIASETVTGYITIKDSGGTERKLAVVS